LRHELRHNQSIQANCREEIELEFALPRFIIKNGEPSCRRRRAANDMDQDIEPAEPLFDCSGNFLAAIQSRNVSFDELDVQILPMPASRSREDFRTRRREGLHRRSPDPFRAAGHQCTSAVQSGEAHQ
jgi:hypothetical protein